METETPRETNLKTELERLELERTEREHKTEEAHEALADESRRVHFLEHGLCP